MSFTWNASLSDGRRISMKDLAKEGVNPWHELVNYVKNTKDVSGEPLHITHLELLVNSYRYNSPSCGKSTLFKSSHAPKNFWILGNRESIAGADNNDYVGLSYRIGDFRHIVWINVTNNFVYNQVLNVVNPTILEEKEFISVETHLSQLWAG